MAVTANPLQEGAILLTFMGRGSRMMPRIRDTFTLLVLLRTEIDRLEKLRRLEEKMASVAFVERPAIQGKIDLVMEEVAGLNRTIQIHRSTHTMVRHF
jgi:hypothetical protein